jgi:hypothetical protein
MWHGMDMTTYRVTVKAEGLPPYTTEVQARNEWHARSVSMVHYPHSLRGQAVDYDVTASED